MTTPPATPANGSAHTGRVVSRFGARSTALQVIEVISLRGKNAMVTGGAAGLGLETSRALAAAGALLTLAVRNTAQGEASALQLRNEYPQAQVSVALLDLADLRTVARLVNEWQHSARPLHVLVNNAAVMACPLQRTAQAGSRSLPPTIWGTSRSPWACCQRCCRRRSPAGTPVWCA